jgi:hypothetical protein
VNEARTGKRFPVHLPIRLISGSASRPGQEGTTENISAAGVYLRLSEPMEVNSRIEFEITVPAGLVGATADVVVRCVGRVIRADFNSPDKGVACLIDEYDFVRPGANS